ncbi:hypothetical protein FB45DRAFT_1148809 [Roridomyces roridus]|uniref:F-box domain-containing protein n=1 Tax=Roridomyces roridus TaxID=1738132 RepID=A0AAD7BZ27_9AGAR|nr:hypothetical protein FB45DRAFT_1148809 [Roridomyces roridus]
MSINAPTRARLAAIDAYIAEHKLRIQQLKQGRQLIQHELDSVAYPILTLPRYHIPNLPPLPPSISRPTDAQSTQSVLIFVLPADAGLSSRPAARLQSMASSRYRHPAATKRCGTLSQPGSVVPSRTVSTSRFSQDEIDAPNEVRRFAPILQRHGPRLRNLDLSLTSEHFTLLQKTLAGPWEALELEELALSVVEHQGFSESERSSAARPFGKAPLLSRLALKGYAVPLSFHLPFEQLVQITCERKLRIIQFFGLLKHTPLLQDLQCQVGRDAELDTTIFIVHAHLRILTLDASSSITVLRHLRLPALHSLRITRPEDIISKVDFTTFLSFIRRVTRVPMRLSKVLPSRQTAPFNFTWLAAAPRLSEVSLSSTNAYMFDFKCKLDGEKHPSFLPLLYLLESPRLANDYEPLRGPPELQSILLTRCPGGLRSVRLVNYGFIVEAEYLQYICRAGPGVGGDDVSLALGKVFLVATRWEWRRRRGRHRRRWRRLGNGFSPTSGWRADLNFEHNAGFHLLDAGFDTENRITRWRQFGARAVYTSI